MSKRRLSKRQQTRIREQQDKHLAQAKQAHTPDMADSNGMEGTVVANFGVTVQVEDNAGNSISCNVRQNMETLVCGDHVIWQQADEQNGIVVALVPRNNFLARPDRRGKARVIAANIDQILIVSAARPAMNTRLIDRYLVAAETAGIIPVIVFNKIDLPDAEALAAFQADLLIYTEIGYQVVFTSAKQHQGLAEIQQVLNHKTSVVVGQSGVGKSSLLNCLLPEAPALVGDVSDSSNKGRHTTTLAQLYHLPSGGRLIDSPGVREFGLWEVSEEQAASGFIEFRPWLGRCQFRDCRHGDEPGCAIRHAVESGEIHPQRWDSYKRILESLAE
ncbi:MAG: small ribosomal subunit biogenesis GTPase RsgA [Gammaproteobacteria bacterium]|nr:small ribosomal subunit biogenesis GTPase RsgA [Gammaproteobacteria bacterium]MDH5652186.1 small ribosomal subunit biogenesis GTPase RsgA [Gammaproteobacteria bacterium]